MPTEHLARGGTALARKVKKLDPKGQKDYWLEPIVLVDADKKPIGLIEDGDAVIFCCRRGEREIQLTEAFVEPERAHLPRRDFQNLLFVTLTLYDEKFEDNLLVAFPPKRIKDTLGKVVSRAKLRQLRVAESAKFAHVTTFFNGHKKRPFPREKRKKIPSPEDKKKAAKLPEQSLPQVTDKVLRGIKKQYDLIVANLANGDVIGHTKSRKAKKKCAQFVDAALGEIVKAALAEDYVVFVTADHGILEKMVDADGKPSRKHTTNPVPFVLIDPRAQSSAHLRCNGKLADIAPTVLCALDVPQPDVMKGRTLAPDYDWGERRRVLLLILDGWGEGKKDDTNPIFLAKTPVWDKLTQRYPCTCLQAAGGAVGLLPGKGKPGNSEAGHVNIGAGRVVEQDDVRIDDAIKDNNFANNQVLCDAISEVKQRDTSLHLIGLLSKDSSHGSIEYPLALLQRAKAEGLSKVYLHIIFDGRSTKTGTAPKMLKALESQVQEIGIGQIVSGVGRGIALDRDGDYTKTKLAYDALVNGVGKKARCTG